MAKADDPPRTIPHIYDVPDRDTELLYLDVFRNKLCQLIRQYLERVEAKNLLRGYAFVVGIHGPWGSGKSTLMQMVGDAVKQWCPGGGDKPPTEPLVVEFQAWKYNQREVLWRALLSQVVATVEEHLERMKEGEKKKKDDGREICERIREALYRDYESSREGALSLDWSALPSLGMTLATAFAGGPNPMKIAKDFIAIFKRDKIKEYHARIRSLEQFQDEFGKLRKDVLQVPWMILIDDLDRCLPESAVEIFEATKVFLDVPGVVFILALDKETIRRGLRVRYREEEGEKPLVDPDQYIEKVTNISFVLPTLSSAKDVRSLIQGLRDDARRTDGGQAAVFDELFDQLVQGQEHHMQPNPRRWIRLLNTVMLYHEISVSLGEKPEENTALFLKLLCLSYRWGGFMEAALNSWDVMRTFESAARQAERDFEKFKRICSERYPELGMYAEDANLFQVLLSSPDISSKPRELIGKLF